MISVAKKKKNMLKNFKVFSQFQNLQSFTISIPNYLMIPNISLNSESYFKIFLNKELNKTAINHCYMMLIIVVHNSYTLLNYLVCNTSQLYYVLIFEKKNVYKCLQFIEKNDEEIYF
ncbi:hypothetical protein pb186bvf_007062 [Paramecium bursaria]